MAFTGGSARARVSSCTALPRITESGFQLCRSICKHGALSTCYGCDSDRGVSSLGSRGQFGIGFALCGIGFALVGIGQDKRASCERDENEGSSASKKKARVKTCVHKLRTVSGHTEARTERRGSWKWRWHVSGGI